MYTSQQISVNYGMHNSPAVILNLFQDLCKITRLRGTYRQTEMLKQTQSDTVLILRYFVIQGNKVNSLKLRMTEYDID